MIQKTSATQELEELRQRYEGWSTEDLLRVVHAVGDYRPEAVQVAREILALRDVPPDSAASKDIIAEVENKRTATAEVENKRTATEEPATVSLNPVLAVVCFLFPGILGIAIAIYQWSQGHARRARDAWECVGYGWLLRVVVFAFSRWL